MTDTAQMVCHDCKNTFEQPFVCITCGAQKLYDATLQVVQERAEKAETERDTLRDEMRDNHVESERQLRVWQDQVAGLQDKLKLAELWRTGYEQAKADRIEAQKLGMQAMDENAALRKDAERYRWFRSKRLWDADSFPWPNNFEYPEPCLWDDGEMLDAAIDAARKT